MYVLLQYFRSANVWKRHTDTHTHIYIECQKQSLFFRSIAETLCWWMKNLIHRLMNQLGQGMLRFIMTQQSLLEACWRVHQWWSNSGFLSPRKRKYICYMCQLFNLIKHCLVFFYCYVCVFAVCWLFFFIYCRKYFESAFLLTDFYRYNFK